LKKDELEPAKLNFRNRKGMYIVSDPKHSNIVVIGKKWAGVVKRVDRFLKVIIPSKPPGGTCA